MDLNILRAMSFRSVFCRLRSKIPLSLLSGDTCNLLDWYKVYYSTFPDHQEISFDVFKTLIKSRSLEDQPEALFFQILNAIEKVPVSVSNGIENVLNELAYSGKVASIVQKYQNGYEIDLLQEVESITREFKKHMHIPDSLMQWEDADISTVLESECHKNGLNINVFPQLKENVRGLRGGDTVAVVAPVDSGKTSLLACMATDFAAQLSRLQNERPILWLVNESIASRTISRIYSAATGLDLKQIRDLHMQGKFEDLYHSNIGMPNRIRVKNAHNMTLNQIHVLVQEMHPIVLIVDMLANIKGIKTDKLHVDLEYIWQELRSMGCENDFITIGTVQLSKDGYNKLYPEIIDLKESKVGIQGALDLLIMMGRLFNGDYYLRGISTPKNKIPRYGKSSFNRFEVVFNPSICSFNSGD
jgi:replicative DNA helicase